MTAHLDRPRVTGVGRLSRFGDAAALLLIVSGAAVYMFAQHRMAQLAGGRMQFEQLGGPGGGWNLATWGRMVTLSRVALGLVGAGALVGVTSFVQHVLRRPSASAHEQADDSRSS